MKGPRGVYLRESFETITACLGINLNPCQLRVNIGKERDYAPSANNDIQHTLMVSHQDSRLLFQVFLSFNLDVNIEKLSDHGVEASCNKMVEIVRVSEGGISDGHEEAT